MIAQGPDATARSGPTTPEPTTARTSAGITTRRWNLASLPISTVSVCSSISVVELLT
jgi:hypothetical protein